MAGPVVGIDLGGTKILGVLVDERPGRAPEVLGKQKCSTPDGTADDVADEIARLVGLLHDAPAAVGIGTPGVVVPGSGVVGVAPNLPGFDHPVPLASMVTERVGVAVTLANDVNAAAFGEVRAGAALDQTDVLAVWMGTGLGAGLVLDGALRSGPNGLAGELGHTVVVPGGRRCSCGGRGHVEAYIGRRAMEERARELHASGRPTALVELAGAGRMRSSTFRTAYDAGDDVAHELIHEGLELLGVAVANVVVTVDVTMVVVGGGLGARFGDVATGGLRASLADLRFAGPAPLVVAAALGDDAGAVGAALLAGSAG